MTTNGKTVEGRDERTGRFVRGSNGGPGRKLGSRNKLTTEFLDDLYAKWQQHGADVLERVIRDNPVQFAKIVANVLRRHAASRQWFIQQMCRLCCRVPNVTTDHRR